VILGHHMGEDVLTMVVASGAGAGAMTLALARARLGELLNRLRQWR
jgi:tRNA A58 N-methylase Trm61